MYSVFGSGTCRLLHTLDVGSNILNPIHTFCGNEFKGINFLGKQKNSRNHIQFLKYIKSEIELPEDVKNDFFSAFSDKYDASKRPPNPYQNIEQIRNLFDSCDVYLFEIASIKIQKRMNFYVSDENTTDFLQFVLTKEELMEDLEEIVRLVGPNKKIIFLNHLRLQQFGGGPVIENREIVYKAIYEICEKYNNVFQYDPTLMIRNKSDYTKYFGDPWHYTTEGMSVNLKCLYSLIENIMNNTVENPLFTNSNPIEESLYDSADEDDNYHKQNFFS